MMRAPIYRCGGDIGAEEVVDWLLLHLREEDLPAAFDPRGRNLDVVVHKKEEEGQGQGLGKKYGLREPDCKALMDIGEEEKALQALGKAIYLSIGLDDDPMAGGGCPLASSPEGGGDGEMGYEEELEALQAIYGEEHCHILNTDPAASGASWRPRVLRLTGGLEEGQSLHVWLTAGYPSDGSLPLALLSGPKASSRVQVSGVGYADDDEELETTCLTQHAQCSLCVPLSYTHRWSWLNVLFRFVVIPCCTNSFLPPSMLQPLKSKGGLLCCWWFLSNKILGTCQHLLLLHLKLVVDHQRHHRHHHHPPPYHHRSLQVTTNGGKEEAEEEGVLIIIEGGKHTMK